MQREKLYNLHSKAYFNCAVFVFKENKTPHVIKIATKSTILSRFSGRLIVRFIAIKSSIFLKIAINHPNRGDFEDMGLCD
jgi:hypothetical protein